MVFSNDFLNDKLFKLFNSYYRLIKLKLILSFNIFKYQPIGIWSAEVLSKSRIKTTAVKIYFPIIVILCGIYCKFINHSEICFHIYYKTCFYNVSLHHFKSSGIFFRFLTSYVYWLAKSRFIIGVENRSINASELSPNHQNKHKKSQPSSP